MSTWIESIRRLGFVLMAFIAGSVCAESSKVSYPPVPVWVKELNWTPANISSNTGANSSGIRYLLYESQDRPKKSEQFVRIIKLMENQQGVQDSGSLRFNFDAEFQELCLHRVTIHREGKTIDALKPAKVRIIQPETELSDHLFNGDQTAVLFVEDLRVGDALEYAYTIRGSNPVLGGHYSDRFDVQSDSTVDRELFGVVWDDKTPLHKRLYQTDAQPVIKPFESGTEYTWPFTNVTAVPFEDYQPASYEPYSYVEVSDFPDWRSVVDWALPLYNCNPTNIPPELREQINRWKMTATSSREWALFALQFVQDEVRYTGIELGPDSYRPADPIETFEKRFGDCKGKTVLLNFLLRQMNIESYPVLVNASVHEAIANRLPSPFVFDHVILQIKLDGKTIWVDPTYSHQGGSLENHYVPPYGKGLVIRSGNQDLEDIPRTAPENAWQQKLISTYSVGNHGSFVPFTVRTEYRGASADNMREDIAGGDINELAKKYLNYYARSYPDIVGGNPLKVTDDRRANVLSVEENYTIKNFWTKGNKDRFWNCEFYADGLYQALTDPDTRVRKTPLSLRYPQIRQQTIIVHLPDKDWQIPDLATNIENDAFSFHYHRHLQGKIATYNYECRTKLPSVPVKLVPRYLSDRNHMEDLLTDSLEYSDPATVSDGTNWLMVVAGGLGVMITMAGCIWFWRKSASVSDAPPLLNYDTQLQGLGGWLILVGFGLCVAPFIKISLIEQNWNGYFSAHVWQTVAVPGGSSYHPLYGPLLIFEVLSNILVLGMNILAVALFFSKRRAFPRIYIALLLFNAASLILDDIGCSFITTIKDTASAKDHAFAVRAVFAAMIWVSYTMKSRRVKQTFIR